jgi:DNA-binding MarR family transcriptional regulator
MADGIQRLKKGHLADILDPRAAILAKLSEGQKHIEQLIDETGFGPSTVDRNITVLEDAGLIKTETEDKFPRRRFVSLTDKGRKIAEHLNEVRKILEEG